MIYNFEEKKYNVLKLFKSKNDFLTNAIAATVKLLKKPDFHKNLLKNLLL